MATTKQAKVDELVQSALLAKSVPTTDFWSEVEEQLARSEDAPRPVIEERVKEQLDRRFR